MANDIVTIPSKITKGEELVVISRSLFEEFLVWQGGEKEKYDSGEVREVLEKVARGRKTYKEGKTYVVKSPRQLLSK